MYISKGLICDASLHSCLVFSYDICGKFSMISHRNKRPIFNQVKVQGVLQKVLFFLCLGLIFILIYIFITSLELDAKHLWYVDCCVANRSSHEIIDMYFIFNVVLFCKYYMLNLVFYICIFYRYYSRMFQNYKCVTPKLSFSFRLVITI